MLLVYLLLIIIFPVTFLLLVIWFFTKKKIFGKIAGGIWLFIFSLIGLMCIAKLFTTKMTLDRNEIYGEYVINKNKCAGKQANWQYDHYRFKITEGNKIYFYITEKEKIVKTLIGTVEIREYYTPSPRLKIKFEEPKFHILQDDYPTLYREIWTFYYVFHSEKFGNMFFTKGEWKSND